MSKGAATAMAMMAADERGGTAAKEREAACAIGAAMLDGAMGRLDEGGLGESLGEVARRRALIDAVVRLGRAIEDAEGWPFRARLYDWLTGDAALGWRRETAPTMSAQSQARDERPA
jgi:hypothetical protein